MKIVEKPSITYEIKDNRLRHFNYVIKGIIYISGPHRHNCFKIEYNKLYYCHICSNDVEGYIERITNSIYRKGKFEMIVDQEDKKPLLIRKKLMSLEKCWWLKNTRIIHSYDREHEEKPRIILQEIIEKSFEITFYKDNNVNIMTLENKDLSYKSICSSNQKEDANLRDLSY